MKILLGNRTLSLLAGSETWTETMAKALKASGHEIYCYTPSLGIISDGLKSHGILCFDFLPSRGIRKFSPVLKPEFPSDLDFAIVNHNDTVRDVRAAFPDLPIVSTIHGVIHWMETPHGRVMAPEHPAVDMADAFVAVSEEVKALLSSEYDIDSVVIRNPVDGERFSFEDVRPPNPNKPKTILFNSNYSTLTDDDYLILKGASDILGTRLILVGQNFAMSHDTTMAIAEADVVVGMGRSVLEGMAMGRLGVVHGRWGTGGPVTEESINRLRACNFSGRDSGGDFMTPERLAEAILSAYSADTLDWSKEYIALDHSAETTAKKYAMIGEKLLETEITEKVVNVDSSPMPKLKLNRDLP